MRFLGVIVLVAGFVIAYYEQKYTLPRIGLQALDFGSFVVSSLLLVVAFIVASIGSYLIKEG